MEDRKSLVALTMDLIELDPDAPENELVIKESFDKLQGKVDSFYIVDSFSDSQIDLLKAEVEHLKGQIKKFERIKERLRDSAYFALKTLGEKKLTSKTGHHISLKTSESVEVTDISLLPDWAVRKTIEMQANKTMIKEALKEGEKLDGAILVTKEYAAISRPRSPK